MELGSLPAASRTFATFKYSDEIESVFLSQGINSDGARGTSAYDCHALNGRDRHGVNWKPTMKEHTKDKLVSSETLLNRHKQRVDRGRVQLPRLFGALTTALFSTHRLSGSQSTRRVGGDMVAMPSIVLRLCYITPSLARGKARFLCMGRYMELR